MMGWRTKLADGDEWDFLTRGRNWFRLRAGTVKQVKRKHNKRARKEAKEQCRLSS